jgi:hypothetical protein
MALTSSAAIHSGLLRILAIGGLAVCTIGAPAPAAPYHPKPQLIPADVERELCLDHKADLAEVYEHLPIPLVPDVYNVPLAIFSNLSTRPLGYYGGVFLSTLPFQTLLGDEDGSAGCGVASWASADLAGGTGLGGTTSGGGSGFSLGGGSGGSAGGFGFGLGGGSGGSAGSGFERNGPPDLVTDLPGEAKDDPEVSLPDPPEGDPDDWVIDPPAPPVSVPGPVAGVGLPALLALGGFIWARRRKAVAA